MCLFHSETVALGIAFYGYIVVQIVEIECDKGLSGGHLIISLKISTTNGVARIRPTSMASK
jgi:hypothetical protein